MDGQRIELKVEVDPDSDPIKGLVRALGGDHQPFRGWTELMAAIDAALSPETRSDPEGTDRQAPT